MEFVPLRKDTLRKQAVKRKKSSALASENEEEIGKRSNVTRRKGVKHSDKIKKVAKKRTKLVTCEKEEPESSEETPETENRSTPTESKKVETHRLFVNMKKKILNEIDVKELHPDIVSIRLPRKKSSKWCWAVFDTQEKAEGALNELKKRKDVIVTEPLTGPEKQMKMKKKKDEAKSRKSMRKKLRMSWL